MSSPLVSISVPVYNAEKYLRKCLDSLVNQTLKDIEIVVVNDGSTDGSADICREYAERDSRILLIFKENGGLASARQAALEAAHGQFFCACDADDWAETTMYEKLYKKAIETGADIVMCDYWSEYPDGKRAEQKYPYEVSERVDLLDDLLNGKFPKAIWNKLIRREVFLRKNLSWQHGINQGEDFLMMMKLLSSGVSVTYLPECLYHYWREMNGTSYTNNITTSSFRQSVAIREWMNEHIDSEKYARGIYRCWVSAAFMGLRVKDVLPKEDFSRVMKEISLSGLIKYRHLGKKSFFVLYAKLFGYKAAKSLCDKAYKKFYR